MDGQDSQDHITIRLKLNFPGFKLDVDEQLPGRGVSVLFGTSGSGKTTLLRCIAGLEQADKAYVNINGHIWQDSQQQICLPTHQRPLGYVFQEASLFPHLSVHNNLQFGRKRSMLVRNPAGLDQAVELLGIGHLLERMPQGLSGGERQRVAIARALAVCPEILLMDEPLAALDPARKKEILPFLQRIQAELKIPVLYVTHSPQEVTQLADHLLVMEQGRVIASGELQETLTRLDLPTADRKQASTVLLVRTMDYDSGYQLLRVNLSGHDFLLPYTEQVPPDTLLRLRIYARDISLTLSKSLQTSILNILPVIITGISDGESGRIVVQLQLGDSRLLAHITRKSSVELDLKVGMQVFAQIKATSVV